MPLQLTPTFFFPNEQAIKSYLDQHSFTREPFLFKSIINKEIAKIFANKAIFPYELDMKIAFKMVDLKEKSKFDPMQVNINRVSEIISRALKDLLENEAPAFLFFFPDEQDIKSYLDQHSLTNDSFFKESKLNEAIAKIFAGSVNFSNEFDIQVTLKMVALNEELGLHFSRSALKRSSIVLSQALKDLLDDKGLKIEGVQSSRN